jgi:hypothetical protein
MMAIMTSSEKIAKKKNLTRSLIVETTNSADYFRIRQSRNLLSLIPRKMIKKSELFALANEASKQGYTVDITIKDRPR